MKRYAVYLCEDHIRRKGRIKRIEDFVELCSEMNCMNLAKYMQEVKKFW